MRINKILILVILIFGLNIKCAIKNPTDEFKIYIENNDFAKIYTLIKSGADIGSRDRFGKTPLIYACIYSGFDICKLLIENGANVNYEGIIGQTALHFACSIADFNICKLLVEHGAMVNIANQFNETPLHCVCLSSIGKKDLDEEIVYTEQELIMRLKICELLIKSGANINSTDFIGNTPLHLACQAGLTNICELLILNDSDDDFANHAGVRSLHLACAYGYFDICQMLIENGANVNVVDGYNNTPLHWTCAAKKKDLEVEDFFSHLTICKMLLKNDTDIKAKNCEGDTPLHIAAKNGYKKICIFLLNCTNNKKSKQL